MEGVHAVGIEWLTENGEVAVPDRASRDDDVVCIHFANRVCNALHQRLELRLQHGKRRVVRDGLVQ